MPRRLWGSVRVTRGAPGAPWVRTMPAQEAAELFPLLLADIRRVVRTGKPLDLTGTTTLKIERVDDEDQP